MRGAHAGDVFTISLHQHNNYPLWKPPSSIDVDLPDGTGDDDYLAWLDNALSSGLRQFEPDLLCYIAGADPYREDQLGGLDFTIEGLKKRDELVFRVARARDIPVMVTYAGGYAQNVEDTVTIHSNTVIAAKEVFSAARIPRSDVILSDVDSASSAESTESKDPALAPTYNKRYSRSLGNRARPQYQSHPTGRRFLTLIGLSQPRPPNAQPLYSPHARHLFGHSLPRALQHPPQRSRAKAHRVGFYA